MVTLLVRQNPYVIEEPQYRYAGEKMAAEISKAVGIENTRLLQDLALDVRDVFYYPHVQLKPRENLIPQLQPIWDIVYSAVKYRERMSPDYATVANKELSESAAVVFITSVLLQLKKEKEEDFNKVVEVLQNPDIEKEQPSPYEPGWQPRPCQQQIDRTIDRAAARSVDKVREFVETEKQIEKIIDMIKTAGNQPGIHGISKLDRREIEKLVVNANVRELIKYLTKTNILKLVGSELSKTQYQAPELGGITTGSRIENIVPSELLYPEEEFYRRYVEGELLIYEKMRKEKKGMIYVLLDISGSMSGTKELWSKSLALALLLKAQKFKYQYCFRFFEYNVSEKVCIPPSDVEQAFTTIATMGVGGGTDISKAVLTALDDLKGVKGKMKAVYLITDGEDKIDVKKIAEKLAETKSYLISIMIQGENPSLRQVSLKYFTAKLTPEGILDVVKV